MCMLVRPFRQQAVQGPMQLEESLPEHEKPIKLIRIVYVLCTILKLVPASAAKAKLGALFLSAQEARITAGHKWGT